MPKRASKQYAEDDYTTVRLPNDLIKQMDALIGVRGFKSRSEIIKEAIRDVIAKYPIEPTIELPRFEHFNVNENGARIIDRKLKIIADVDFKPKGIYCHYDQCGNCEHIRFALTIPVIKDLIRKHQKEGWTKLPDV